MGCFKTFVAILLSLALQVPAKDITPVYAVDEINVQARAHPILPEGCKVVTCRQHTLLGSADPRVELLHGPVDTGCTPTLLECTGEFWETPDNKPVMIHWGPDLINRPPVHKADVREPVSLETDDVDARQPAHHFPPKSKPTWVHLHTEYPSGPTSFGSLTKRQQVSTITGPTRYILDVTYAHDKKDHIPTSVVEPRAELGKPAGPSLASPKENIVILSGAASAANANAGGRFVPTPLPNQPLTTLKQEARRSQPQLPRYSRPAKRQTFDVSIPLQCSETFIRDPAVKNVKDLYEPYLGAVAWCSLGFKGFDSPQGRLFPTGYFFAIGNRTEYRCRKLEGFGDLIGCDDLCGKCGVVDAGAASSRADVMCKSRCGNSGVAVKEVDEYRYVYTGTVYDMGLVHMWCPWGMVLYKNKCIKVGTT